jgi:hypothetical protein
MVTIMTNRTESHAKELGKAAMQHLTAPPSKAALAEMKQQIMMQSMLEGINFSFLIATFIAAVALVLSFFIKRSKQAEDLEGKSQAKPSEKKISSKLAQN